MNNELLDQIEASARLLTQGAWSVKTANKCSPANILTLVAEVRRKDAALQMYGRHLKSCDYVGGAMTCTCGLDTARAALGGAE